MAYTPGNVPEKWGEAFRSWLAGELRKLAAAINGPRAVLQLSVLEAEPARRQDGMIVFADGATWNPGAGAGTYERRGGAWVKL